MDTELTAFESRRTKARHINHGMMQALLTGRIRLMQAALNTGATYGDQHSKWAKRPYRAWRPKSPNLPALTIAGKVAETRNSQLIETHLKGTVWVLRSIAKPFAVTLNTKQVRAHKA